MFLIFLEERVINLFQLCLKFRPVFELLLFHPQFLLFLSKEVDLDIAVGNQWNKAVAEEQYAESDEKD